MAVYRNVQVNFWQDDFVLDLTPEERYFYVYLLTCSKTTQCGIFPFPKRLAEMETGYNRETVDKLLQRFVDYGKILYDAETRELFVLNWLRYNPVTNTNVEKCVLRELKGVKNKEFVHMFLQKCAEEELNVPMLLAHFGMPGDLAMDDVDPVCEEAEEAEEAEEVAQKETGSKVFTFYEQHFGSLSPYTVEELNAWMDELSEELVLKALQISYENKNRKMAYVKAILRGWHGKGFTKVSEVAALFSGARVAALSIQNVEAEKTVLGSLLLDGELIKECRLTEQYFSMPVHKSIFQLMRKMEEEGQPIDLVTFISRVDPNFLKGIGGMEYFIGLMDGVPATRNFSYYEGLVRGAWKMYQAGVLGHKMGERLIAEKDEKIIGETITALCELEEKDCVCEFDLKDALVGLYEELHQDVKEITGIDTGYTSLNKMTCGLQEGDFVVLGARPSMGKTAFALNVGLHAAKSGAAVGLFSLEMSSKQLLKRMASCVGEVSGGRLKNPKHRFALEDWKKVSKAFAEIGELPLEIYDQAGVTVQDIWMQTRKLKRKHSDKKILVIVDYLQLITGDPKHKGNRFQEISEISRKLKLLARDLNVCVVALSQLSRSVESRQDKRPLLSDLRETGQIEQDADVIMLMYREDYYDKETKQKEMTEIHVAKHRNGPVGSFKLRFLKEFGRFVENGN